MTDIFTKEKRSEIMSKIRSKDTKIERIFEQKMRKLGIIFKKHYKIIGTPDFVIEDKKIAIFLDSSFFHGHPRVIRRLKSMSEYWQNKIQRNKIRASKVNRHLKKDGWVVLRFWDFEVEKNLEKCIEKLKKYL